jgi:hypothetical protein
LRGRQYEQQEAEREQGTGPSHNTTLPACQAASSAAAKPSAHAA